MKKRMIVTMLSALLAAGCCLTGCSGDAGNPTGEGEKSEFGTDFALEYYMLPVTDYEPDWDVVLAGLIEDYDSYKDDVQISELDTEPGAAAIYSNCLLTDGPAYEWWSHEDDPGRIQLWKYEDGVIDEEAKVPMQLSVTDCDKAKEQALEVAELFDVELVCTEEKPYTINDAIDIMVYDFQQQYKGTYIARHTFITVGNERLSSPSFYVDIDGNGMCVLSAGGLLEIGEPLKTYSSGEFLAVNEVEKKIESYCASQLSNITGEAASVEVTIEDAEVVYIPYVEKEQKVLIPAYELIGIEADGTQESKMRYVVDVFTGYVYERGAIE